MIRYGSMGQMHRRPDQQTDAPPSAVAPTQAAGILRARAVIIFGTGASAGLFVYNGTPALGNPPQVAIVPTGVTSDPFGNAITSSKILIQGNIITESGGIFRTAAAAPLMQLDGPHNAFLVYDAAAALKETIAPVATNDGLGNTVQAGFTAYTAGLFAQLQAAALSWGGTGITVSPAIGSSSVADLLLSSGQTAGNTVESILDLITAAAGAIATARLTGALQIIEGAVPAAATGVNAGPKVFGNTSGHLGVVADSLNGDGNTYDAERLTLRLTSDFTINSTTPQTIMSKHVGIGTYEIEVWLVTQNATAADAAAFAFTAPASTGLVDCKFTSSGVSATTNYAASTTPTASFSGIGSGGNQQVHMLATITFSAAGTLALTGKELVAGNTINVSTGSRMRVAPIVAT